MKEDLIHSPQQSFRQLRMLVHVLRGFGYQRTVSFDSFRKSNFMLVADILFWLCGKLDPNNGISPNINGEAERVFFLKQTLSLLASKTRVNINPLMIYYADYKCIPELLKIVNLLYRGTEEDHENTNHVGDFTLPSKFDKRKTKDLAKEITQHGMELYELMNKEGQLEDKMKFSIEVLERVMKEYNQSNEGIEQHIQVLVKNQNQMNDEIIQYQKKLEKKEQDLIDRIRRKKMEGERLEKKLRTLSNIKPAHIEKMERYEKELERLFQMYLNKMRNLDYLESTFDEMTQKEKEKNKTILSYLEKMQVQIQKNEEKMFENNINDMQVKNINNFKHKFLPTNPIIEVEEKGEDDEDYVFQFNFNFIILQYGRINQ